MSAFTREILVRFRHCDPAGIVFFPRYFEMVNDMVEDWFAEEFSYGFDQMHPENGVPTAAISTKFSAPSRQGDLLRFALSAKNLGRTSLTYELTAHCGEDLRLSAQATLVHVNGEGRPTPWPDALRAKIAAQLKGLTP